MKVAITSAGSCNELRRKAEHAFKLLGYKDIFSFEGSECKENNIDIVCIVAPAILNRSNNTYYIRRGATCSGSRDFKDKHDEAIVCMYVEETNTIYKTVYSYNLVDSLESHILVSTVPLRPAVLLIKVDKEVKPDVYYLTESVSMKGYHYLKSKFPRLDINYYTCDISKASFPNLREEDLVFLDFKDNKFVFPLSFTNAVTIDRFAKLISRKNTFLMYEPAYEERKIPYRVTGIKCGLDITVTGVAGTTKDIYELIDKSTKKPINESIDQTEDPFKLLTLKSVKPTSFEQEVEMCADKYYRNQYLAGIDPINNLEMFSDRVSAAISSLWKSVESKTSKPNNVLLLKNKKR
jgi:hypothetical protein